MSSDRARELRDQVISQLAAPAMVIHGEDRESSSRNTFVDFCPGTGAALAELPAGNAEDVDNAVISSRDALERWSGIGGRGRSRLIYGFADAIEANQDRISHLESTDNGRPQRETASQASIVADWFRYFAGLADKLEGSTIPVSGRYLNYTQRVPVGVCGAITPWNHPMLIATKKVAPAIACGNTIVVKPSELAPLSVVELGRIAIDSGIPPGVINVVTGGREAGEAMAVHPGIDRIDVTGSTPTGVSVARAAAGTLKRVGMELGGKAANIVFETEDLARVARGLAFSAFIAQGQSCVAGSRVLVQANLADELAGRVAEVAESMRIGDPLSVDTQMGPVISTEAADRIRGMIAAAEADGASVLAGGVEIPSGLPEHLRGSGFLRPTVLQVNDPAMKIASDEIFGPVLTLTPFETEEEAVAIANSVPFGLGSGVWTADIAQAHRVAAKLRVGVVWINDYHRIDPASPWGGFKLSGFGRENGHAALEEYTAVQSVWVPLEEQRMDWYEHSDRARLN